MNILVQTQGAGGYVRWDAGGLDDRRLCLLPGQIKFSAKRFNFNTKILKSNVRLEMVIKELSFFAKLQDLYYASFSESIVRRMILTLNCLMA